MDSLSAGDSLSLSYEHKVMVALLVFLCETGNAR